MRRGEGAVRALHLPLAGRRRRARLAPVRRAARAPCDARRYAPAASRQQARQEMSPPVTESHVVVAARRRRGGGRLALLRARVLARPAASEPAQELAGAEQRAVEHRRPTLLARRDALAAAVQPVQLLPRRRPVRLRGRAAQ